MRNWLHDGQIHDFCGRSFIYESRQKEIRVVFIFFLYGHDLLLRGIHSIPNANGTPTTLDAKNP